MPLDLAYEKLRKRHLALLQKVKKLEKEIRGYGSDYQLFCS